MNTPVRYIKSFSKGQITIPQEIRKSVGIGDDFWLKLYVEEDKIVAEPVKTDKDNKKYLEKLLKIKGDWFSFKEFKATRSQVEKRFQNSE